MENMSFFDIIILTLIILLGLKGLFRGLTKELFAIIGIIGGIFIASRIAPNTGGLIDAIFNIENDNTMLFIGFLVSLAIIWSLAYFGGIFLSTMFSLSGLGIFDKVFGFIFGATKVFLLFSIIFYALSSVEMISKKMEKVKETSLIYPLLISSGGYIIKLNHENIQNTISQKIDTVTSETKNKIDNISNTVANEKLKNLKEE